LAILPLYLPDILDALDLPQPGLVGDVAWRAAETEIERALAVAASTTQPGHVNQVIAFDVAEGDLQVCNEVIAFALTVGASDAGEGVALGRVLEGIGRPLSLRPIGFGHSSWIGRHSSGSQWRIDSFVPFLFTAAWKVWSGLVMQKMQLLVRIEGATSEEIQRGGLAAMAMFKEAGVTPL
jgi:hypothetical protein